MDSEERAAPSQGFVLTHFLTVSDVARSTRFYTEVLGGTVTRDEKPGMVKLANSWIIMNPGGGPTDDKPDVTVRPPSDSQSASSFMNIRVADIQGCYEDWTAKGAEFLTPPTDRGDELRCHMRDPDGYLIEVGQSTGLLEGRPTTTG